MAGEAQNQQAPAPPNAGSRGRMASWLVVAGIMLGEGVAILFLARAISTVPTPAVAAGEQDPDATEEDSAELAEVEVAECRPSNVVTGRMVTFHIRVSALVTVADLEHARKLVEQKQARLQDGVNVVIRGAEPKELNEPGLETLRRRLKHEFARIFNDPELIKQVLIPYLLQSGAGV